MLYYNGGIVPDSFIIRILDLAANIFILIELPQARQ